jgi:hypothetical protein
LTENGIELRGVEMQMNKSIVVLDL